MRTANDETLRRRPQRLSSARTPAVRPLAVALLVQGVAIVVATLLGLPMSVVVAVVVGIAVLTAVVARRTIGSLVAGAGLRVAQPYEPGEQIRVFVPSLNSVEDAEIVRVGPANTTLMTASGIVLVPNAHMLRGTAHTS